MDKLKAMQVFVQLVDMNGFSRAADALNLSRAAVTRHVQELEEWLGTTLINRTTRKMQITSSGAHFYEHASRILGEVLNVELELGRSSENPRGTLRVHAPGWLARILIVPVISDFCAAHPSVSVALSIGNDHVDPLEKGFDCVLATGPLPDSSNIARTLGAFPRIAVASLGYVEGRASCPGLTHSAPHTFITTQDYERARRTQHRSNTTLIVNDFDTALLASLSGLGVATLPCVLVQEHLEIGSLAEMHDTGHLDDMQVLAVLPPGKRVPALSRAFTQWIASSFPSVRSPRQPSCPTLVPDYAKFEVQATCAS